MKQVHQAKEMKKLKRLERSIMAAVKWKQGKVEDNPRSWRDGGKRTQRTKIAGRSERHSTSQRNCRQLPTTHGSLRTFSTAKKKQKKRYLQEISLPPRKGGLLTRLPLLRGNKLIRAFNFRLPLSLSPSMLFFNSNGAVTPSVQRE